MGLTALEDSWENLIKEAALPFMTATIVVFKDVPIDSLFTGLARVQQIRQVRDASTTYEWATQRSFRFQIDYDLSAGVEWHKGLFIRVLDGGRDELLERYAFEVTSAINSDHRAVRTIEATTEGTVLPKVVLP